MILKIYYDNIEIGEPLTREENDLEEMLDFLKDDFAKLVDNIKVLKYFGITFTDGK